MTDKKPPCTTSNGFASIPTPSTAGLTRRGLAAAVGRADRARRDAARAIARAASRRRRGATRPRRRSAQAKAKKDEATAQKLMAEVAELKTTMPALEAEEKEARRRAATRCWRKSRTCRSTTCRTARTSTAMSSITSSAPSAITRSRRSSISNSAKRSAMMDFETGGEISGARFVVLKKRAGAAGARARAVHARRAYRRARLHRSQSAAAGARRGDVRHGAIAEVRGGSISCHSDSLDEECDMSLSKAAERTAEFECEESK